jgi:hypothetical protein
MVRLEKYKAILCGIGLLVLAYYFTVGGAIIIDKLDPIYPVDYVTPVESTVNVGGEVLTVLEIDTLRSTMENKTQINTTKWQHVTTTKSGDFYYHRYCDTAREKHCDEGNITRVIIDNIIPYEEPATTTR